MISWLAVELRMKSMNMILLSKSFHKVRRMFHHSFNSAPVGTKMKVMVGISFHPWRVSMNVINNLLSARFSTIFRSFQNSITSSPFSLQRHNLSFFVCENQKINEKKIVVKDLNFVHKKDTHDNCNEYKLGKIQNRNEDIENNLYQPTCCNNLHCIVRQYNDDE